MSETTQQNGFKVYAAIAAVADELSHVGIAKDRKNTQQGFSFRGIDDVLNALSPVLAKHKLVILPKVLTREVTERATKSGGALFSVAVKCEYTFVSAEDGSKHTVEMYGEAMDSGDKATNKAVSAAYKYAAFQTFCIPIEGMDDADADTPPAVAPQQKPEPRKPIDLSDDSAFRGSVMHSLIKRGFKDAETQKRVVAGGINMAGFGNLVDIPAERRKPFLAAVDTGTFDHFAKSPAVESKPADAKEDAKPIDPKDYSKAVYAAIEERCGVTIPAVYAVAKKLASKYGANDIRTIVPSKQQGFIDDIKAGKLDSELPAKSNKEEGAAA